MWQNRKNYCQRQKIERRGDRFITIHETCPNYNYGRRQYSIDEHIEWLEEQLKEIESLTRSAIAVNPDWQQKIVEIGPNMLELLLALDIQPIGYADYFALPAQKFDRPSQQIPFLGERITSNPVNMGTADNPNLETIAQLQPDLSNFRRCRF